MKKTTTTLVLGATAVLVTGALALILHRPASASPRDPAVTVPPPAAAAMACRDEDGDGYGPGCAKGADCNELDRAISPGQLESCNGRDDDCNGLVDDAPQCSAPPIDPTRVHVPAGVFAMGSDVGANDEKPVHTVRGGAFDMDRYEVTNARYRQCVDAGKCTPPSLVSSHLRPHYFDDPAFAAYPVVFVAWSQAAAFCDFAHGRLPTEAEWERAARGTDAPRMYPWGEQQPDCTLANLGGAGSCVGDTDRVGRRPAGASPYGALDMAGNVWEWTSDWYGAGYYAKSASAEPKGPALGTLKVMRGGCWESGADSLRSTCRKPELPSTWAYNVGMRCVYPTAKGGL